jgi:hypothetical protein
MAWAKPNWYRNRVQYTISFFFIILILLGCCVFLLRLLWLLFLPHRSRADFSHVRSKLSVLETLTQVPFLSGSFDLLAKDWPSGHKLICIDCPGEVLVLESLQGQLHCSPNQEANFLYDSTWHLPRGQPFFAT